MSLYVADPRLSCHGNVTIPASPDGVNDKASDHGSESGTLLAAPAFHKRDEPRKGAKQPIMNQQPALMAPAKETAVRLAKEMPDGNTAIFTVREDGTVCTL